MGKKNSQKTKINVAILDDHQSSLDSYAFRLSTNKNIEVVATASYGNELEPLLETNRVDVLVLDVSVPNSQEDRSPYPILYLLPRLRKAYPKTAILIISMHNQRSLVKAVLDAGASGYILKEDRDAIIQLAEVVTLVKTGGIYISKQLRGLLSESKVDGEEVQVLSKREREALSLSAAFPNITTEELGKRLDIAPSTLRNLLSKAYRRLKVRNRTAAIERARQLGLIGPIPAEPDVKT